MSVSAAAYLVGRRSSRLEAVISGPDSVSEDMLFAGQRIDSQSVSERTFRHCTFANVSFKDCDVSRTAFQNCVFADCYFRETRIYDCRFSACKFIACDFTKVDLRTSDLRYYNAFRDCWIKFGEVEHTLPPEPNLRAHLCLNLAEEARDAGALADAELYRQTGARANEEHLKAAVRHSSAYYRDKFRGTVRLSAFGEYAASRLRGYLWGYRRSFLVVLRNWAIVTLVAFPLLFLLTRSGLSRQGHDVSWADLWRASLGAVLPGSGISDIDFRSGLAQALAFFEVLFGLLFAGLVVALIFRAVFERWR
jgi:hypothetical protein